MIKLVGLSLKKEQKARLIVSLIEQVLFARCTNMNITQKQSDVFFCFLHKNNMDTIKLTVVEHKMRKKILLALSKIALLL